MHPLTSPSAVVLLRRAEHVLFAGLLVFGAAQSVTARTRPLAACLVAAAVAAWYGYGAALSRRGRAERADGADSANRAGRAGSGAGDAWLLVLAVGWVALAWLSVSFVWLVFPVLLLAWQLLPTRYAVPSVVGLTAAAIAAFAMHEGGFTAAGVLGPSIGAAVAVVISVVYQQLRDENERRANLLMSLAAAQEQLSAIQRQAGTLAERERLAGEIHDTIAQSLASIVLLLRSVTAQAAPLPGAARKQLDTAAGAARTALEDTRRLVRALHPADLAGQSLTDALRRLADDTTQVGITTDLAVDGEPYELPAPIAVALLRTAQGAVGNIVAHAHATRARLTLTYQPGQLRLDIVDNGRGFDPDQPLRDPKTGTGIGLAAMRHRLAAVAGTLTIESTPGGGTAIGASIPVEASRD